MEFIGLIVLSFVSGIICAAILGIWEYTYEAKKKKLCNHESFKEDGNYSHYIYNKDKSVQRLCKKYICTECGKVEYE